jgi:hypothetical protein
MVSPCAGDKKKPGACAGLNVSAKSVITAQLD